MDAFAKRRLELDHGAGFGLGVGIGAGGSLRLLEQCEQRVNVLLVLPAQFDGVRIRLQIVVAIRKAQPALIHDDDFPIRLFVVRTNVKIEERTYTVHVQSDHFAGQLVLRREPVDGLQQRLDRLDALALDRRLVHAGRIIIADLRVTRLFQDAAIDGQIAVGQFVEARPARLIGRNGIVFPPTAASVLVKILARVDRRIHGFEIHAGCGLRDGR